MQNKALKRCLAQIETAFRPERKAICRRIIEMSRYREMIESGRYTMADLGIGKTELEQIVQDIEWLEADNLAMNKIFEPIHRLWPHEIGLRVWARMKLLIQKGE